MAVGTRATILIVDDEGIIALAEKTRLESRGYTVLMALGGEEAVELMRADRGIDLVLMDIDLGAGIDGTVAASRILEIRHVPVVFLSSHTEPEVVERTEGITSYGYVVKNSGIVVLDASIKMAFKLFEANRRLDERDALLRATIANISDSIAIIKPDWKIGYLSPNVEKVFGWTNVELEGKDALDFVHPEDRGTVTSIFGDLAAKAGRKSAGEFRAARKDGTFRYVEFSAANLLSDPSIRGILVDFRDTTERRRAGDALKRSEGLYRSLFDNMLNGFAYCRMFFDGGRPVDFVYLAVNDAFESLTGLRDVVGRRVSEVIPGILENDPDLFELYGRVASGAAPERKELYLESLDMWFLLSVYCPERGHFVAIFDVITERKRAEIALRESEERFRRAISDAPFPIMIHSEDGAILSLNKAWTDLSGYSLKDIPDVATWAAKAYGEDEEAMRPRIEALYSLEYRNLGGDVRIRCRDGSFRIWEFSAIGLGRRSGGQRIAMSMAADVTDRRRAEDRVRDLLSEKELILQEVHHRIKNNMATIAGLLTLQTESATDPLTVSSLSAASGRIRSMMLLYDRLYRSAMPGRIALSDYLSSLVDDIVSNLPEYPSVRVEKELGDFLLDVRQLQLLGIIVNELLTNIVKHAFVNRRRGSIRLEAMSENASARLVIADDGEPMPASVDFDHPKGFGLVLVSTLTQQLGGRIAIERGEGTRVVIEFALSAN